MEATRQLAAIVFTDIVGFSSSSHRDEAMTLELVMAHREVIRSRLNEYNGREVRALGDGFLLEFVSALDAVRFAIAVQKALQERNRSEPPARHIRLRIGIHLADVEHKEGDIWGDGVNIAARLEPLAESGGICLSGDVARQVGNKIPYPLERLGRHKLKNIALPVEIYRVALPDFSAMGTPPTRRRFRRAVPFVSIAGLLLALGLGSSFFAPFLRPTPAPNADAQRRFDDAYRLLDERTPDDTTQAGKKFDDLISRAPSSPLGYAGKAEVEFIKANYALSPSENDYGATKALIGQALERDPGSAEALAIRGKLRSFHEWDWVGAKADFDESLKRNPDYAPARRSYALYLLSQKDFKGAIQVAKQAKALQPKRVISSLTVGITHYYAGNYTEAERAFRKALALNTKREATHLWIGMTREALRDFDGALKEYGEAGDTAGSQAGKGYVYATTHAPAKAKAIIDQLKRSREEQKRGYLWEIAVIYTALGDSPNALVYLRRAKEEHTDDMARLNIDPRFVPLRNAPEFQEIVRSLDLSL